MRKLIVSEFVTLDGVMDDPGGSEGLKGGGWAFRFERGPEGDKFKLDETMQAEALLLGRVTYEGFASAWPGRTDEVGFADKMNGMQKYVVSSTLREATWNNTTIISGDLTEEVAKLKAQPGGNLLVAGSRQLVQALLAADLIDELRLMVYPTVLGSGKRLFDEGGGGQDLRLTESRAAGETLICIYEPKPSSPAPGAQNAA
jgi:dihydrofolate reductase